MKKPLDRGEIPKFARFLNEKPDTVRKWWEREKLNDFITDKKIDHEAAAAAIYGRVAPKQAMSVSHRWEKERRQPGPAPDHLEPEPDRPPEPTTPPEPEQADAINNYLRESLGDVEKLDIHELQRRNELEKLLLARLRRAEIEKTVVPVAFVQKEVGDMCLIIKNGMMNFPDRLSAMLAVEDDPAAIKKTLKDECRFLLQQFSDEFLEMEGYKSE